MPTQKDLKRLVRARMRKTGESYTAARAQLIARRAPAVKPAAREPDYAALAGMSDAAVKKATGCPWKRWVGALDALGAASLSHPEIARLVAERFKVSGWWSQSVTVGYERIRGLRDKGQRRGGGYEVSKSRTFPVSIDVLYGAFAPRRLARWLDGARPALRKATEAKSMRFTWEDGTKVEAYFLKKGDHKSQVALQHRELRSRADAERMRAFWTERLAALGQELA